MLFCYWGQHFVLFSLSLLILKFFESYVTTKAKCKQIKITLILQNTKSLYSQFCILRFLYYLICSLGVFLLVANIDRTELFYAVMNTCGTLLFPWSFFNPLLYYWRIKEIRDRLGHYVVRGIIITKCCKTCWIL